MRAGSRNACRSLVRTHGDRGGQASDPAPAPPRRGTHHQQCRPGARGGTQAGRCRRQGRHHQALHGAHDPAHRACRGAGQAERARAQAVVLPALRGAFAGGRRNGAVRPLLVQPGQGGARDGLLFAHRMAGVHAPGARGRTHADALGHQAVQVPVRGVAGGAAGALQGARRWHHRRGRPADRGRHRARDRARRGHSGQVRAPGAEADAPAVPTGRRWSFPRSARSGR